LKATLAKDPKLVNILASPTLKAEDKKLVVTEISKAAGQDKTVKNLLEVLAENNRLGLVNGIIEKYGILMGAHRGEIETIITSAVVSRGLLWMLGNGTDSAIAIGQQNLEQTGDSHLQVPICWSGTKIEGY